MEVKNENNLRWNTETKDKVKTMNKRQFRFVGTAISGAVVYLGISLILASLSISPIDVTSLLGGFVTIGLGIYIFFFSIKGA